MMLVNEEIIRELYAAAEGQGLDVERFVSFFCEEGYMYDIPSGIKFRGQAIGDSIGAFASAFPDVHRELTSIYVAENVVVVELATRGTNKGAGPFFWNSSSHGQGYRCPELRCFSPREWKDHLFSLLQHGFRIEVEDALEMAEQTDI